MFIFPFKTIDLIRFYFLDKIAHIIIIIVIIIIINNNNISIVIVIIIVFTF